VVTPIWFVLLAVTYQFVRSKRQPRATVRGASNN
jgi:D-serine/D-alanine/glycine transporter